VDARHEFRPAIGRRRGRGAPCLCSPPRPAAERVKRIPILANCSTRMLARGRDSGEPRERRRSVINFVWPRPSRQRRDPMPLQTHCEPTVPSHVRRIEQTILLCLIRQKCSTSLISLTAETEYELGGLYADCRNASPYCHALSVGLHCARWPQPEFTPSRVTGFTRPTGSDRKGVISGR